MTAEDLAYRRHLATCTAAEHGRWCRECDRLIRDADAADFRPKRRA